MAKRIKIPFLIDVVIVKDAQEIQKIEASGDTDRLHYFDTKQLPGWAKFYFKATKFHDFKRDLWFCPFEPKTKSDYSKRKKYLEDKVAEGYTKEDVLTIANLLKSNADKSELTYAMVQVVNKRFFKHDVPQEIINEADNTLQSIGEVFNPKNYKQGCKSQALIMDYCEKHLEEGLHLVDIGHNIGEVVQASAGALVTLKENIDQPIAKTFTQNPLTPQVPRIAIRDTNIGGLLKRNAIGGKTVFICKIGEAAKATSNLDFTFGTGDKERECIFRDFFMRFMNDVKTKLQNETIFEA